MLLRRVGRSRIGRGSLRRTGVVAAVFALAVPAAATAAAPQPGTPEYVQRDNQNIADAYGRQTAPDGQLLNPHYLPALIAEGNEVGLSQLAQQAANPNHVALSPGNAFPRWNAGNPPRRRRTPRRGPPRPRCAAAAPAGAASAQPSPGRATMARSPAAPCPLRCRARAARTP